MKRDEGREKALTVEGKQKPDFEEGSRDWVFPCQKHMLLGALFLFFLGNSIASRKSIYTMAFQYPGRST